MAPEQPWTCQRALSTSSGGEATSFRGINCVGGSEGRYGHPRLKLQSVVGGRILEKTGGSEVLGI